MKEFLLKEIKTCNIAHELEKIGFDLSYCKPASEKFLYKNIKIFNLNIAQANILKQTALTVGADCATNREVVTGKQELSDVILGGSHSQLRKIGEKLKHQPFQLKILGENLLSSINTNNKKTTKLAGILNITPDSFSDGGKYFNLQDAQNRVLELIKDGADIIDIGAETTKPFSTPTESSIQIERLKPVLEFIQKENFKTPISIDTRSSEVADFALNNGASIINDVSGFDFDKSMPEIIAKYNAEVIIQHSKGTPDNMQVNPEYDDVVEEIFKNLKIKIDCANAQGINKIIIDPGIGFGKTKEHNFEILDRIEEFFSLNCPIMIGVSRKSMLCVNSDDNALKDSLTLAISYPLIIKRVDFLRVHNVKLHKQLLNSIPSRAI